MAASSSLLSERVPTTKGDDPAQVQDRQEEEEGPALVEAAPWIAAIAPIADEVAAWYVNVPTALPHLSARELTVAHRAAVLPVLRPQLSLLALDEVRKR